MELIFERSRAGRRCLTLPKLDVPEAKRPEGHLRAAKAELPEVAETTLSRHFNELAKHSFGVNDGFYPLGSCTMKYNPKINELVATMPGFAGLHPLQPAEDQTGVLEALARAEELLCTITGMDAMTLQPAAGAHGELTALLILKAYLVHQGQEERTEILIPDSAHGTNPASAAMAGFKVITVKSAADGCVDLEDLKKRLSPKTAGLMLTNPNTVGIFDKNILEITRLVHEAGGLNYYDGANLNAVLGVARPGDMGFDLVHLNLHKTFSTPHGGGGPGAGPVGCKDFLRPYLPTDQIGRDASGKPGWQKPEESIGRVKSFYGHTLVVLRALTYILSLGKRGLREAGETAVLNANYLRHLLEDDFHVAYPGLCMHEFVLSLENYKKETGVSALDFAKAMLDRGMHPPTMYFPLIVKEALMFEPTETESPETLEQTAEILRELARLAHEDAEQMHNSPLHTAVGRPDETEAARNPILKYEG